MPYRFRRYVRFITLAIVLTALFSFSLSQVIAQEDNICRNADAPIIADGETLTGVLDGFSPANLFCFEADRGTQVTITVTPSSQNLLSAFIVGTPFISNDGSFVDEPLLEEVAASAGSPYQGTVSITADGTYLILVQALQETQGSYSITLEQSGGNVLGSSNPEPEDTTTDTEPDDTEPANPEGISNIIFGETDLCTTVITTQVAFGDTVEGSTDANTIFYCFAASEGDIVTVDFTVNEVPMAFGVVDPLYDGAPNAPVYAQGVGQVPNETVSGEFVAPRDGNYVVVVASATQDTGDFTLSVDGVAGNIYTCENEPISTLVANQWGIVDSNGTAVIEINIACSERLSIAALGGATIVPYSVSQSDEFFFVYRNRLYITTELSESEWILEREDGTTFTLAPLTNADTCSDEQVSTLIRGSWFWQLDPSQQVFLDFTCNGIVLIDDQQSEPIATSYEFTGDEISITLGEQGLLFENVTLTEQTLFAQFSGIDFEITNTLFEAEAEPEATED